MSMVGKKAPDWSAIAHVNGEETNLSSADLKNRWYLLYWYPLDFTFVCPTEIAGFQSLLGEFELDEVSVVGVSTDSFYSHKAWFSSEAFPEKITHPIIADTNHSVSKAFDVLNEEKGIALRATVLVDGDGVVRSYCVNDTEVGRSPKEVLRTVQAFLSGGLCGADWQKGDRFVG